MESKNQSIRKRLDGVSRRKRATRKSQRDNPTIKTKRSIYPIHENNNTLIIIINNKSIYCGKIDMAHNSSS